MNANTIVNALHIAGQQDNQPIIINVIAGLTTPGSSDVNPLGFGTYAAVSGGAPIILAVPSTPAQGVDVGNIIGVPGARGSWYADGQPFLIRAAGLVTPNQKSNLLCLSLMGGGAGINQPLIGTIFQLPNSNPFASNFLFEVVCLWDSVSNTLTMVGKTINGGIKQGVHPDFTQNAPALISAPNFSGLNFALLACITPGPTSPTSSGVVTLTDFSADVV